MLLRSPGEPIGTGYLAPWEVVEWYHLLGTIGGKAAAGFIVGSAIPGVGNVVGFFAGAAVGVGAILGTWLGAYINYKTKYSGHLPDVQDVASILKQVAPKLTEAEALNLMAYLQKAPSNFEVYWQAWQKLDSKERSLIQAYIISVADRIPQVTVDWQRALIAEYCKSKPGGCGPTATAAVKESEKKAASRGECADWDWPCRMNKALGKTLGKVIVGAAVVGILYLILRSKR